MVILERSILMARRMLQRQDALSAEAGAISKNLTDLKVAGFRGTNAIPSIWPALPRHDRPYSIASRPRIAAYLPELPVRTWKRKICR